MIPPTHDPPGYRQESDNQNMAAANATSIVIPTLNGGALFKRCLQAIRDQEFDGRIELVVIDSGSTDGTAERAEAAGAAVIRIPPDQFHHADTRNLALRHTACEHVVFMVQDAIPATPTWLQTLNRLLCDFSVAAAYGRPIAHEAAGVYARFEADGISRYLGSEPYLQELSGAGAYSKMSFEEAYRITRLDNVCAIYRREALIRCPFPRVPYAEDMAWARQALLGGAKILYSPEALVKHSHERSPAYIFRRHVVDGVYCAKILDKLRSDLSEATAEDLINLNAWAAARIDGLSRSDRTLAILHDHPPRRLSETDTLFGYLAVTASLPGRDRFAAVLREPAAPLWDRPQLQAAASRMGEEIEYLWNFIKKTYTFSSVEEAGETLEKIAACVLGKCYGDVYASHASRGSLDAKLHEAVDPHLRGI